MLVGMFGTSTSSLDVVNMDKNYGPVGTFISELNYKRIGEDVRAAGQLDEDLLTAAISICRRRFKPKDIVLVDVLDEDRRGEKGIVFSENSLFYWDSEFICSFDYSDIDDVDYDDDAMTVTVKTLDQKSYELECGGDCDDYFSRYMYNFLMDIKDYLTENHDLCVKKTTKCDDTYFDEDDLELVDSNKAIE